MAIVRKLERMDLDRDSKHTEVNCTYCLVTDEPDDKYLQIDTYGSIAPKIPVKKSQSIRFSTEAIAQLLNIIKHEF